MKDISTLSVIHLPTVFWHILLVCSHLLLPPLVLFGKGDNAPARENRSGSHCVVELTVSSDVIIGHSFQEIKTITVLVLFKLEIKVMNTRFSCKFLSHGVGEAGNCQDKERNYFCR